VAVEVFVGVGVAVDCVGEGVAVFVVVGVGVGVGVFSLKITFGDSVGSGPRGGIVAVEVGVGQFVVTDGVGVEV
jgi:hypothetical protein